MIELAVYENNVNLGSLEITDSNTFPLALTKSNSDIRDITKRQGAYSKDFDILATTKNNRILKYIYNANVTPLGTRQCVISNNGMPIITGNVFVVKIAQREAAEVYTLRVYSDNVDWYFLLGNKTIRDYDYGNQLTPSFTQLGIGTSAFAAARNARSTLNRTYINASWLFPDLFDYVYPLISYGQPDLGTNVTPNDFRPAIYIGKMLAKAFAQVGYTLDSGFFSTGIGSRLILPYTEDNFKQDGTFVDENSFIVAGSNTLATNVATYSNTVTLINNTDIEDSGNRYNNTTGIINIQSTGNYAFAGKGQFQVNFIGQTNTIRFAPTVFLVGTDFFKVTPTYNGASVVGQKIDVPVGQPLILDYDFSTIPVRLIGGTTYKMEAIINIPPCIEYFTSVNRNFSLFWIGAGLDKRFSMQISPEVVEGQDFTISRVLPELKVLDILSSLQNMFNLYYQTDNDSRTVTIEPKEDLVQSFAAGVDYSGKLDISQRATTDIIQSYNRTLEFRFAEDSNDKWQDNYNLENGSIYGSVRYDLGDEFKEGITEVGTKYFAPTVVYDKHPFSPNGCPIPVMWSENVESPPKSYDFLPRVLYYKGLLTITQENATTANWRWMGNVVFSVPTSFMLDPDTAEADPVNILYGDKTGIIGLARNYYNGDIATIADKRVHKMYFKITGTVFRALDLFKPIYIDHANLQGWYYINQVIDFKPNQDITTLFELVKAFDSLPFDSPTPTEIPITLGGRRRRTSLGGGTLTADKEASFETSVTHNGSGNIGIIRGGGTVSGNGNIQTGRNQHIFGNYNYGNDSIYVVGAGLDPDMRYNGLQFTREGRFMVHGGKIQIRKWVDGEPELIDLKVRLENKTVVDDLYLIGRV